MHLEKRILVTGGAGFLGSHLCERLLERGARCPLRRQFLHRRQAQHRAICIGHKRFELMRHDVTFPLYVEVDEIYNLACPASPVHYQHDPVQTTKTSVHGAINMLGLAKRLRARILQASTSEVYGDPKVHPQPEEYWGHVNPIGTRSCYDEGKRCAETLFFDYRRQHRLRIKVARIFNTYGPRMHPNDGRVVSNFIVQALLGRDITIYGDGPQTRSFCYVDDLVDGLIRLMETADDVTGPINLGNPAEFTIRELAEIVIDLTGSRSRIVTGRCPPTIRASASPTSPRRARCWDGRRARRSRRGWCAPSPISSRCCMRRVCVPWSTPKDSDRARGADEPALPDLGLPARPRRFTATPRSKPDEHRVVALRRRRRADPGPRGKRSYPRVQSHCIRRIRRGGSGGTTGDPHGGGASAGRRSGGARPRNRIAPRIGAKRKALRRFNWRCAADGCGIVHADTSRAAARFDVGA